MPKSVEIITDLSNQIGEALKALTDKSVYVGIPSSKTDRTDENGAPNPINNAVIGYCMENGMPEQNVPARPFLVPGVRAVEDKVASIFGRAGKNALEGDIQAVEAGLNAAGMVAVASVKKTIRDIIPPPLAESTLERRRAKGRTGETPLIDTAQLLNSNTYVVRK